MIELINLSIGYNKKPPLSQNLNFTIEKNDIVSIVGDNGSGKTTLLKVIAGHLPALKGEIRYQNLNPIILFVPANLDYFLFPWYKVYQNISFFHTRGKTIKRESIFSIKEIQNYLPNIKDDFGKLHIYSLSSGEKAVVAFVCAVHAKPDILILDEIFSNTTKSVSFRIIEYLNNELNITVIFTSHIQDFIQSLSKKIIPIPV